ncbi:hypothetical protein ACFY3M_42995 [Streptomyces mirabilis]|uniref:hypothetical protein n=1 Tax=Streptomyces mirabilis TaxID=68239 RepID=UPI00369194DF
MAAIWRWAMTDWLPCRAAAGTWLAVLLAVRELRIASLSGSSGADLRMGVRCVPGGLREGAGFAEHRRQAQGRQHAEAVAAPAHTAGIGHGGRHLGLGYAAP